MPLSDADGNTTLLVVTDSILRQLHFIDQQAAGSISVADPVLTQETRDQYIIRSLMEEAITSSQLEGAATTRRVAEELIRTGRKPRDESERMILNNFRTMEHIRELRNEPLTPDIVFKLHRSITQDTLEDPSAAGRFRNNAEYRVVAEPFGGEVFHEPPHAAQLKLRMEAMCDFANGKTPESFLHPVVRSILLHFWLAYDHPFVDGNGRTARALFYWSMLRQNYWLCEFLSISEIILKAPAQYGRAFLLTETDNNDLTYFVIYHLEIIQRAIENIHGYVHRKTRELESVEEKLRGAKILNHRQLSVVGHALRHPRQRYTIEGHRRSHNVTYQTARADLLELAELKLFEVTKSVRALQFIPAKDIEKRLGRIRRTTHRTRHKK